MKEWEVISSACSRNCSMNSSSGSLLEISLIQSLVVHCLKVIESDFNIIIVINLTIIISLHEFPFNNFFSLYWHLDRTHSDVSCTLLYFYCKLSIRLLLVESSVIVIFYVIFLMCYGVNINHYFGKKKFPIKKNQGINNCFKPLTLSLFTSVASRLKSKQKEKEK